MPKGEIVKAEAPYWYHLARIGDDVDGTQPFEAQTRGMS